MEFGLTIYRESGESVRELGWRERRRPSEKEKVRSPKHLCSFSSMSGKMHSCLCARVPDLKTQKGVSRSSQRSSINRLKEENEDYLSN